ncbi:MAG: hypothetical protein ACUVS5_15005, partial [Anaerolineae bacterium]
MDEGLWWKWLEVGEKEAERLEALVRALLPPARFKAMPDGSCAFRYLEEGPDGVVARAGLYRGEFGDGESGAAYYGL